MKNPVILRKMDALLASEQHLLTSLQQGDERALRTIFDRYYPTLLNDAYRVTNDKDASRDVVQEVFAELWKKRSTLLIQTSLRAYLRRSVVNRSLNFVKMHRRMVFDLPEDLHHRADDSPEEMAILAQTEEREARVRAAIESLPEKCRLVFSLSRFEKMSHKEISEQLNISVKTIENQITKAMKTLREALHGHSEWITFLLWCWLMQ